MKIKECDNKTNYSYEEKLIVLFENIKNQKWIPYTRKQKKNDGLIRNIFEDSILL